MGTDIDISDESSGCMDGLNSLILRPVSSGESGEGLPYAPVDWPNPGDIWTWKVGKRKTVSGYWCDRFLFIPSHLPLPSNKKRRFASRYSVEQYIRKQFPNADVDAFFASFSWKVPSKDHPGDRGYVRHRMLSQEERADHSGSESKFGTTGCKARNKMCRLGLQEMTYSPSVMECDICCSEPGFCRDCCCILCSKTVDWAYGGYSFIRCEARGNEGYICGHVAHLNCALHSYMAGTVGGSIGLDVEYYCRRCDKRTDLISHVTRFLKVCGVLDSRGDIEKILNLGLSIWRGSQKTCAKRLLNHIELAVTKLKNGTYPEDFCKVENNILVASTGEISHLGSSATMLGTLEAAKDLDHLDFRTGFELTRDNIQKRPREPVYITSDHGVASVKLENKINQVLQDLRKSQESEYRIAEERLHAQKDFLLGLYQQLDMERSELAKRTSSTTDSDFDDLLTIIVNRVNQIKQEVIRLGNMEEVAKGFGRTSKAILQEHFGLEIED